MRRNFQAGGTDKSKNGVKFMMIAT